MSSSQQVTLIVDVDDSSTTFSEAGNWQYIEEPIWYRGNAAFVNASGQPWFELVFHGTSITLYGNTDDASAELDHKTDPFWSGNSLGQATYWYESPPLPDQEHKLRTWLGNHSNNTIAYIDYALIKAGATTNLSGRTIFVDDANVDEIWYTGEWILDTDTIYPHRSPNSSFTSSSANRTVHYSNTSVSGHSFEFRFAGTSISVYGLSTFLADYTVDFIMDGDIQSSTSTQENSESGIEGWTTNHKFYENTTLRPGNHTLTVHVTNFLGGASFYLDYITYTPSFSFIHEKPTFIRDSEDHQPLPPSSAVSPSPIHSPSVGQSLKLPIGAIVGIIIAGLSIMTITGLICCWTKRYAWRKGAKIASRFEPFAARFPTDSKPKPSKWRGLFPSDDMTNSLDPTDGGRSLHMQHNAEVQQRNDEIASLTAQMERSDGPSRVELYSTINTLRLEVERLVRENAPPEYGGSDVGQRPSSRSGTLPSYSPREGP